MLEAGCLRIMSITNTALTVSVGIIIVVNAACNYISGCFILLTVSSFDSACYSMTMPDKSSFPVFGDGDVQITITSSRIYQLHSAVLRKNSTVFNDLLKEELAASLSLKARSEGRVLRYWLELVQVSDSDHGVFLLRVSLCCTLLASSPRPLLTRTGIQDRTRKSRSTGLMPLLEVENGKPTNDIHRYYDHLFHVFYHLEPCFDDTSIAALLSDCIGVVDTAAVLGSTKTVSQTVDIRLLRQGTTLFRSIVGNPVIWSELALKISSPTIFKEAIIHLVGQWQSISAKDRQRLRTPVATLCSKKHAELDAKKEALEIRLAGLYPAPLARYAASRPSRMSYGSDIYGWMTMSLFRHWFAQAICEGRGRSAKDGGANLYRQLGKGGYTYLDRNVMEEFHEHFPMTQKGKDRLENRLSEYKEAIKLLVRDLLVNNSELDVMKEKTAYLTCCEVTKADFPWEQANLKTRIANGLSRLLPATDEVDEDEVLANCF